MEATAPGYYMYVCMYFHIIDNGQCGNWADEVPKNENVKCHTFDTQS